MIRVNIRIHEKVKKYYEDLAKETGCSQSALMSLVLHEYATKNSNKVLGIDIEDLDKIDDGKED